MRLPLPALSALLLFALPAMPAMAGGIRALLVGIGEYPSAVGPEFPSLEGPPNDLKLMKEWLVKELGVPESDVRIVQDAAATSGGIQRAFDEHLIRGCEPDDVAVFYFTGHGTQLPDLGPERDEADEQDEALVTADFRREETSTWLTDDVIHRHLSAVKARHVLVLYDCCHAGTGTRGIKGAGNPFGWGTRSIGVEARLDTSLRERGAPDHHVFLAACGDGELARQVYDDQVEGVVGVFSLGFRDVASSTLSTEPLNRFESALRENVGRRVKEKINESLDQRPVLESNRRDFSLKAFLAGSVFAAGDVSAPAASPGVVNGFTSTGPVQVTLETKQSAYRWTENLQATIRVDRQAYVRVFHVDAQGSLTQIHPNSILPQSPLQPGSTLHLPPQAPVNGRQYELRITAPGQGLEALIAVACTRPFSDREAREFAGGLFNALPQTTPAQAMSRGIDVEPREGAAPAHEETGPAAFGQAVRIYRTSQY